MVIHANACQRQSQVHILMPFAIYFMFMVVYKILNMLLLYFIYIYIGNAVTIHMTTLKELYEDVNGSIKNVIKHY